MSSSLHSGPLPDACPLRLSLCMIVKNEARNLGPCLRSIKPVLDEIIIVDTGSTDETKEVARQMGANVFDFPWCDDFSAARNESIRHATGDYILWLDADDRVDESEMKKIGLFKKGLPHSKSRAFYVVVKSESPEGDTLFHQLRIFPRVKGAAFEGKIHEQIFYRLQNSGVEFIKTDIVIRHLGYHDTASRHEKSKRNLDILQRELEENPGNLHVRYNMARTLSGLGRQAEAILHLQKIVEEESVRKKEKGILLEASLLIGKYSMEMGRYEEAVAVFRDLSRDFQGNGLLHFFLGEALFFTRDFPGALEELEKAHRFSLDAGLFPINLGRLDYFRHYRLGQCYLEVGQIERAKELFLKSVSLHPDHGRSLESLGHLCLKNGRFEEAVSYYEKAVEKGGGSDQVFTNLGLAYGKLGKEEEGEKALSKALEINPRRMEALTNLGYLYSRKKALPQAVQCFQKALLDDPGLTDVRLSLSEIYFQLYEIEGLVAQCEALRRESGLSCYGTVNGFEDLATLYKEVADCFLRSGRNELSLSALHVAFLIFPSEETLKKILSLANSLKTPEDSLAKIRDSLEFHGHSNQLKQQRCPETSELSPSG